MNGYSSYSKIKAVGNEKENSRSMDSSSDLNSLSETSKPITSSDPNPSPIHKNQPEIIKNPNPKSTQLHDSSEQELDEFQEGNNNVINNGEMMFDPKLRRNSSVSSAYALQAAVKRAFSMRRSSSSVSERYCRIHDQSVTLASPFDDDDDDDDEELDTTGSSRRSVKKKKKKNSSSSKGKILKACKKLFGL